MSEKTIKVPDIGGSHAEVIELCVQIGDTVDQDDALMVLESDKATMEVPSPEKGEIISINLKVGDQVQENDLLLMMRTIEESPSSTSKYVQQNVTGVNDMITDSITNNIPVVAQPPSTNNHVEKVLLPDIGTEQGVITDICVTIGAQITIDDTLIIVESDKASMDIPTSIAGTVTSILVHKGDKISQGHPLVAIAVNDNSTQASSSVEHTEKLQPSNLQQPEIQKTTIADQKHDKNPATLSQNTNTEANYYHAGPAVRKLARELGVDLFHVTGSAPHNRIVKEDVHLYVKNNLTSKRTSTQSTSVAGIPSVPVPDFSQWGEIEIKPLTRLRTVAAHNFQSSWLNVPHVTQFDEADITDLEILRKSYKKIAEQRSTRLTLLPFILKACAFVLKNLPQFCTALSEDGQSLIYKKYIHIGIAVDTPNGLLVPVIKNVLDKGLWQLAQECIELAEKARTKKLKPTEMQGGCFTISSLGSIGGTAFTPIVNAPEVAILGLSKATIKPIWDGKAFIPKQLLPLSLSYDHRAINGADAARFTALLAEVLGDMRKTLFF